MLRDERRQTIAGISLLLFAVLLFLSYASYTVNDYAALRINQPVANLIGPLGAWIGHSLRTSFGYTAYLLVVVCIYCGLFFLGKVSRERMLEKIFALLYIMITGAALLALLCASARPQLAGGYIGIYFSEFLKKIVGTLGAWLVVLMLNVAGFLLFGYDAIVKFLKISPIRGNTMSLFLKSWFSRAEVAEINSAPLNSIGSAVVPKSKKMPWITRAKIIITKDKRKILQQDTDFSPKLVEMPVVSYHESPEFDTRCNTELKHDDPVEGSEEVLATPEIPHIYFSDDASVMSEEASALPKPVMQDALLFSDNSVDSVPDTPQAADRPIVILDAVEAISPEPDEKEETSTFTLKDAVTPSIHDFQEDDLEAPSIITNRIRFIAPHHDVEEKADEQQESVRTDVVPSHATRNEQVVHDRLEKEKDSVVIDNEPAEEHGDLEDTAVFKSIPINQEYIIPMNFLHQSKRVEKSHWREEILKNSELLVKTLQDFGIESKVVNVNRGPVLALYEIQIAPGIKVNKIVGLSDDIAMALAALRVRIVAPIPGKSAVGIEIPNKKREKVTLGDVLQSAEYKSYNGILKVGVGKDILGMPVMLDLKKQPHLLIAGATGAGKSVTVNALITSLVYNYDPNRVRFIMIDPKMVELQLYNGLPHLLTPVIVEPDLAPKALKWAVYEMERRYKLLSELCTRDIERYNQKIKQYDGKTEYETLPYIVIIVDELADLMMTAAKEVENYITRIAQKARAVGIHLVLATQRPSVDVITGIIKANFPARVAFQVAQKTDSRTILDRNGAEKLLGRGDMLYQSPTSSFPVRVQGAFISEDEIIDVVRHARKYGNPHFIDIEGTLEEQEQLSASDDDAEDELFSEALKIIEETKKASASYLQRRLSIGYNRAARIIEYMEDKGYVGPQQGSKPREVYL